MRRVLVLRPEPGASATIELARQRGLDAISVPLFEIQPMDWNPLDPAGFDGLLVTSANAIRTAGDRVQALRGLPVYAVGRATAEAAREGGFAIKAIGKSNLEALLDSLETDLKLLHLCGEDRRDAHVARQEITPVIVYRSKPTAAPDLSSARGAIALIHSPRAGRRFAELVKDRSQVPIAAISRAAAEEVGGGWKSLDIADQPTDEALLALASRLCNNPHPK